MDIKQRGDLNNGIELGAARPANTELHIRKKFVHLLDLPVEVDGVDHGLSVRVPPPVPRHGSVTPLQTIPAEVGRGARRIVVRPVQPLVAAGEGGVQVERLHVGVAVQAAEQQCVTVGQAGGLKQNSSV